MPGSERSHQVADKIVANGVASANTDVTTELGHRSFRAATELGVPFNQFPGQWQKFAPAVVQPETTALAREQLGADLPLQLGKGHARCRLAEEKPFARSTNAARRGDGDEDFELARADGMHKLYLYTRSGIFNILIRGLAGQ